MNKRIIPAEASFFVPVEKVLFDHSRMRRSLETAAVGTKAPKRNLPFQSKPVCALCKLAGFADRAVFVDSAQTQTRDAFGSPYLGNLENDVGFGYCGKVYDIGTGLYDYGFRDYSPNSARFTTVDPIRDGSNWFSYVVNDPVNYVDPNGYNPVLVAYGTEFLILLTGTTYIVIKNDVTYQEAITQMTDNISNAISKIANKYSLNNLVLTQLAITALPLSKLMENYSKGKKVRDKEGNPIPTGNQKQSPLGKGAHTEPIDIGNPGDLGGEGFNKTPMPPKPGPLGIAVVAAASVASIVDNAPKPKSDLNFTSNKQNNNSNEQAVMKKGK